MTTHLIRNALAIRPLAAGIGAVDRIRPFGGEGFSTAFANPILSFFQPPLLQIFLVSTVPAQMVIAIFLGADLRVEDSTTALADDFPHSRVRPYPGELFFIPLLQRFLIFIFPIAVPHGIFPSFHRSRRAKYTLPAHSVFIRLLLPASADTAFCCALSSGKPHSSISHRFWWW